jgi:hypothetical protein
MYMLCSKLIDIVYMLCSKLSDKSVDMCSKMVIHMYIFSAIMYICTDLKKDGSDF